MNLILDVLFPKRCVGCGKLHTYFCKLCVENILQGDLICPQCFEMSSGGQAHPDCKDKLGLDGLWSLGLYKGSLKTAIKKLKYKPLGNLATVLVDIMLDYFAKYHPLFLEHMTNGKGGGWIVVPVPLHWYRQNWRGFNQSSLIAKRLADKLELTYLEALRRIKYTRPQVKLKSLSRYENIRDAFSLNTKYVINNTHILLVDDVWTTGATMNECCRVLKQAGAKKVWAITLAR